MLLVVLVLGTAPATAFANPQDIAATHSYIEANYTLARANVAEISPGQAQIEHLNGELAQECPGVGAGSPETEASQPMAHDVTVALWSLAYGADAGAIRKFTNTVGHLHWSNHAITRDAQTYARNLRELATLPLPGLCADVRSWKADGFQTVPSAIVSLVNRVESIEPRTVPPGLLAPYERGADAGIVTRTKRLETKLEENEFLVGQLDWVQLLETLGLNE